MAIHGNRFAMAMAFFCLGILAARFAAEPANRLHADDRKGPDTFLSGGARSEKALIEILATLKQLDGRVAGIEEVLTIADGVQESDNEKAKKRN